MLRLSRLSPARAINVRFTTPGHANPYFLDRAGFIDPGHPAAKLALRHLPAFVCPQFTIRAFPNALLHEPVDFVPINPILATGLVRTRPRQKSLNTAHKVERHSLDAIRRTKSAVARHLADAHVATLDKRGRHNISLLFHTSKKATSKSCVIRRRLRSKMTAAIGLVVSRNADTVLAPEGDYPRPGTLYPPLGLISRPPKESESFVLRGWTYLVIPDLTIYKMPLPNLVQVVRKALLSLSQQSKRLEASWSAIQNRKPRSPQRPPSDSRSTSPLRHPHKVKAESTVRTHHSQRLYAASDRTQGSDTPREPARHRNIAARLYSDRPVILPYLEPKIEK